MGAAARHEHQRIWRTGGLLVAAAVLLALAAGCGSPLTEAELAERADAICEESHERFVELQRTPPSTASEAEQLLATLAETAADEGRALDGLRPPEHLEEPYERYLEAHEQGVELLEDGEEAAAGHDARAYERARSALERGQPARQRLARDAGLERCSRAIDER